jgi:hypothetical protein
MNLTLREAVHKSAKHLQLAVLEYGAQPSTGMCSPIIRTAILLGRHSRRAVKQELNLIFPRWPEFSGNAEYPVSTARGSSPHEQYNAAGVNMWDTATNYGAARMRLLAFVIQETAP